MKTKLSKSLLKSLQDAKSDYNHSLHEEQGGFLVIDNQDIYEYIPIRNVNTGTRQAVGLYTADGKEFGQKVLNKVLAGYRVYASYHTHPVGYPARPSHMDLTELFTGFPVNFIYAPKEDELNMFTYDSIDLKNGRNWKAETVKFE